MWRCVVLLPLMIVGCNGNDGETLRKIAKKGGQRLDRAARPVNDAATPLRGSLGEPSVAGRVDARIRHDRYLAGLHFTISGDGHGVVTVSATVPEASLKARALDLARSTAGVENVIDEVKVGR